MKKEIREYCDKVQEMVARGEISDGEAVEMIADHMVRVNKRDAGEMPILAVCFRCKSRFIDWDRVGFCETCGGRCQGR